MLQNYKKLFLLTAAVAVFPMNAQAEFQPSLSAEVVMELQNEYRADSEDGTIDEYNNMFFRTEVAPTLQLTDNIYIDGVGVFENIQDPDPDEHNFFDNEGAFIEELKINFEFGNTHIFAGKFNPLFGSAWDFGRGIWSEDFAEDYEITERIGGGVSHTFETEGSGSHTFTGNAFFADTTPLSRAVITSRDDLDLSDGGVANTEDPSSFAVSYEGHDFPLAPDLYVQVAYRDQAEGDADVGTDRERGFVGTVGNVFPVNDAVEIDALFEVADINNFETGPDDNRYIYGSVITHIHDWNVALGFTSRDIDGPTDAEDHLFQLSTGYDFGQGTTAEIGWRNSNEGGDNTNVVGGLVRHIIEF